MSLVSQMLGTRAVDSVRIMVMMVILMANISKDDGNDALSWEKSEACST